MDSTPVEPERRTATSNRSRASNARTLSSTALLPLLAPGTRLTVTRCSMYALSKKQQNSLNVVPAAIQYDAINPHTLHSTWRRLALGGGPPRLGSHLNQSHAMGEHACLWRSSSIRMFTASTESPTRALKLPSSSPSFIKTRTSSAII
ncbi:unnamed protein product [Pleuronectes platessa]|uniref:Uncharacterized protein n=1 Tax=Pleuronectes platessa TaxID=8262 RepID=A0A9N7VMJ1_PLEPL|nr:unnamed protein product [Pleuronectes platessa]